MLSAVYAVVVCLCVCLSHSGIVSQGGSELGNLLARGATGVAVQVGVAVMFTCHVSVNSCEIKYTFQCITDFV